MLKDHEMSETRTEKLLVQLQVTAAVMNACSSWRPGLRLPHH